MPSTTTTDTQRLAEASHGDASASPDAGNERGQSWIRRSRVAATGHGAGASSIVDEVSSYDQGAAGEAERASDPVVADTRLSRLRHAYARLHQSEDMRLGWLRDIELGEAEAELRAAGLDDLAERAWNEPLAVMVEVGRLLDEAERLEREQEQW